MVNVGIVSVILIVSLFLVLMTGLPIVFVLGGLSALFTILFFGFNATIGMYMITWSEFTDEVLLAIPLFLLMASVLQHSGLADGMYDMFHKWLGGLNGGLAMGTVIICLIFAALTGTSGAATVAMGLIAIPAMIKHGYDKYIAVGCVAAGGAYGIVIPPSIIMILYCLISRVPIGKMFIGGLLPGLTGGAMFIIYIGIRCFFNPTLCPAVPIEERVGWKEKIISTKKLILPLLLLVAVLGSIWGGIATPTEAAAVGAFGAYICAAFQGRFSLSFIRLTCLQGLKITVMIFWILSVAIIFSNLYTQLGARAWIEAFVLGLNVGPWTIIILMALSLFILGAVVDDYAILMIAGPVYIPIIVKLGFDPLWYGVLFVLSISQAFVTPPYGFNLFYIKAITPDIKAACGEEITMGDIYQSVLPFVGLKLINYTLLMLFPALATWLPALVFE